MLGSTSEELTRESACPLLVIPRPAQDDSSSDDHV
jgi:nucleotide-binding universal stress UspA family protein